MTVTLTELAELRLRSFVRGTPNPTPTRGIRFAVKDGGCNGYEYDIKIANAPNPDDEITEVGKLKVFVDPKSSPLLDGIVVDYIDSLLESGFKLPILTLRIPAAVESLFKLETADRRECLVPKDLCLKLLLFTLNKV